MPRFMAFNIWRSGTLDEDVDGERNLAELIEFLRDTDPDVLFMVETYGNGDRIAAGLGPDYTGIRLTQRPPGLPKPATEAGDNLWLFTRLEVERVHPPVPTDKTIPLTSFHFGGARLRLPDGGPLEAFSIWLHWQGEAWKQVDAAVREIDAGRERTRTDAELLATDDRRLAQARTVLDRRLPELLVDDTTPVVLGGDLNALSHLDWAPEFADAPGHGGLALEWPALSAFERAGFVDTYRAAHPDAAAEPGVTWSPLKDLVAPGRIDYLLARGDAVAVENSYAVTRRMERHRGTELDRRFPFYSDHGAVVSDLTFG